MISPSPLDSSLPSSDLERLYIFRAAPLDNFALSSLVDTRSKVTPGQDAVRHRCPRRERQPGHCLQPLRGRRGFRGRGGAQPGRELEAKTVDHETGGQPFVRSVHDRQGGSEETASLKARQESKASQAKKRWKERRKGKMTAVSRAQPNVDDARTASESG